MKSARELGPDLVLSLAEYGAERLEDLGRALALPPAERADARAWFERVVASWPEQSRHGVAWKNDITDDGTPFEFSVGFEGSRRELRLLFESQLPTSELSPWTSWHAGLALQRELRRVAGCDTSDFDLIAPLFAPSITAEPRFSLWHAAVLRPSQFPLFKAYLNPEVHGPEAARSLVEQASTRLGASGAWEFLASRLAATTRLPYLSLDLEPRGRARLKVYVTAKDAAAVEALVDGTSNVRPGVATAWLEQLTGDRGPYEARPVLVCYSFRHDRATPEATVHVPIRSYAPNDAVALQRTLDLLPGKSAAELTASLEALARRELQRSRGVLTYVSLRAVADGVRVTTYLAPGAYTPTEDGRESGTILTGRRVSEPLAKPALTLGAVEELIARRRDTLILPHEFMQRLEGEADLESLARLLPRLAFFTFAFQDMLKVAREGCSDPVVAPIVASLQDGDRGHDRWYVEDLESLGIELKAHALFDEEYEAGRRVAYGLIALLERATSDHARLALLLSLEAAAREFFIRVPGYAARAGLTRELRYFGNHHLEAEEAHEVFTEEAQSQLDALPVPEHAEAAVVEIVEKTFSLLLSLANHLASAMESAPTSRGERTSE